MASIRLSKQTFFSPTKTIHITAFELFKKFKKNSLCFLETAKEEINRIFFFKMFLFPKQRWRKQHVYQLSVLSEKEAQTNLAKLEFD